MRDHEFALIDRFGQTKGTATSTYGRKATLQLAQAKAVLENEFRVQIAQKLADARIRNQRIQLSRLNRTRANEHVDRALSSMLRSIRKLENQTSVEELLGIEGSAAAVYWPALGQMLSENAPANFQRTRPAKDALNAVINYLTAILERDIRATVQTVVVTSWFWFSSCKQRQA